MAKTAQGLVDFCRTKIGTPYVYGAKGQVMTRDAILALKRQYPNIVRDSDVNKAGKRCVDCSGLISWYTGIIRNSAGFKSSAVQSLPISQRNNSMIGWAVWKSGHIGVYIGNNRYIAADGSAVGTREAALSQNSFTHIIKLKDIDYSTGASAGGSTGGTSAPKPATVNSIVDYLNSIGVDSSMANRKKLAAANGISGYAGTAAQNLKLLGILQAGGSTSTTPTTGVGECTGNSVNVRAGAGTNYKVLRQLNKGNLFDILGTSGSWTKVNIVGLVGYVSSQYVKRK